MFLEINNRKIIILKNFLYNTSKNDIFNLTEVSFILIILLLVLISVF